MSSLTVVAVGILSEPVLSFEKWIYSGRRGGVFFDLHISAILHF